MSAGHAVEGMPSPFDRNSRGDRKTAAQYTNFMGTRAVKGRADLERERTLAIPARSRARLVTGRRNTHGQ